MVYLCRAISNPRNLILGFRDSLGFALRKEAKPLKLRDWLGGLDSNQDSQLQRLMYYRLYDLPAGRERSCCFLIRTNERLSIPSVFSASNFRINAVSVRFRHGSN